MTQAKAASLTSALFARKGAASPADMVIADLEDGAGGEVPPRKARSKERGAESAQRRKAQLPEVEQELPLLAFVDAQTVEEGLVEEGSAEEGLIEEEEPTEQGRSKERAAADAPPPVTGAGTSSGSAVVDQDDHPDAAASLMLHRPFAFRSVGSESFADDISEDRSSDAEDLENGTPEAPVVAEDDKGPDLPAVEVGSSDDIMVANASAEETVAATPLESAEAVSADSKADAVASTPSTSKTPDHESATGDRDDASSADPGVSESDDSEEEVSRDKTLDEPESELPAVVISDDPAIGKAGARGTPPTTASQTSERSVPHLAGSDLPEPKGAGPKESERKHAASTTAEVKRRSDDPLEDLTHREMPRAAAANPAVLTGKRGAGLIGSPWRMAAVIALGVGLGLLGYALWPQQTGTPELAAVGPTPAPAAPSSAAPQAGDETTKTAAVQTTADPTALSVVSADENTAEQVAARTAPAAAAAKGVRGETLSQPEPSFDVIRIEPNGQSIIAGRAVPFSEWILLNNGQPIGSVQADLNGEWVILPDASLVPGANDFSLVPKTERGKVAIPAAGTPPDEAIQSDLPESELLAPRSESPTSLLQEKLSVLGQDTAFPLPRLKPVDGDAEAASFGIQASPTGGFQIQIASVRQSAAAERERARLVDVYPSLLGTLGLQVQEASIDGAGVFYRLRSGPIADLADARELCRQLELRGQGCLVVVRAVDEEVRGVSGTDAAQPLPTPSLAPTQQAENPD